MDDLLPLLGALAPLVLVVLAALGWTVHGRRRGPSTPKPLDGAPVVVAHDEHVRRVEVADRAHVEAVAEVERRGALPVEQRREKAAASWKGRQR